MDIPQHVECDTPDCIHWKDGGCAKETSVTIQEHHCVDYEERIILPAATVTIVALQTERKFFANKAQK